MKTIMIIDDELNVLKDAKSYLEKDFKVITVDSNKKAHEIIEKKDKDLGLILIDSNIPNTDIPAFFSFKPNIDKKRDTTKINDFLIKPFTRNQLVKFINDKIR
jgi:DNA-binding NtrC family response regulator